MDKYDLETLMNYKEKIQNSIKSKTYRISRDEYVEMMRLYRKYVANTTLNMNCASCVAALFKGLNEVIENEEVKVRRSSKQKGSKGDK